MIEAIKGNNLTSATPCFGIAISIGLLMTIADTGRCEETMNGLADDRLFMARRNTDGSTESVRWKDCLSSRVNATGIAWGFQSKPYYPYIILDGTRVFIQNEALPESECAGRLVHITGTLELVKVPATPLGSQPPAYAKRYVVNVASMQVVDRCDDVGIYAEPKNKSKEP